MVKRLLAFLALGCLRAAERAAALQPQRLSNVIGEDREQSLEKDRFMTEKEALPQEAFANFAADVTPLLDKWNVTGLALAAVKDGEVVFAGGFGKRNLISGAEVTPQTIFAIGSSSKTFTATALAMLVDDGKLNWDTPLREYLPTFKLSDHVASERMTPRDLLIHNSGLPRHDLAWYRAPLTRKELVERLAYFEPCQDFRSTWQYQNMMYITAGYLVECVSGLNWEEFVQQRLFAPLGMTKSYTDDRSACESVTDYSLPYRSKHGVIKEIPFYSHWQALAPAGSIHSCVEDMSKWVRFHLNKGKVDDQQLVSEAQMTQVHTPHMAGVDRELITLDPRQFPELFYTSYALGWFVTSYRGHTLLYHSGSIDGFHALVALLPRENLGVVTLTNTDIHMLEVVTTYQALDRLLGVEPADWHERYLKIHHGLMDATKQVKEAAHADRIPSTSPSYALDAYAGTFEHAGYGKVEIERQAEQLILNYHAFTGALDHFHYDTFLFTAEELDADFQITFSTNARGDVDSLAFPLEKKVAPIVFKRVASQKLAEKSYLEQFVGDYELKMGESVLVVGVGLQGEALLANIPGQSDELEPCKENEFRLKSAPTQMITFLRGSDGQVSEARLPGGVTAKRKA